MKRVVAALFLLGAAGCAGAGAPRARPLEPLASPAGFCFLVHGIWPDGVWIPAEEAALRRRGVEPIDVEYTTFLPGYALGYGTDRPAERLVAFVRALEARHAASGCAAPLRLHAVGFSGGTMVLLKAAEAGVRFERVYFGGSPLPLAYGRLEDVLREGRVGHLVNYCSALDGLVGVTLGCGAFGFLGDGAGRVENRGHLRTHLDPVFQGEVADDIAREIAATGRGAPAHTCMAVPGFARWLRTAVRRLADGEASAEAGATIRTPTPGRAAP